VPFTPASSCCCPSVGSDDIEPSLRQNALFREMFADAEIHAAEAPDDAYYIQELLAKEHNIYLSSSL
jgi:hypothetical protein